MFQGANRWSTRYVKYLAVAVPVVLCHNLIHEAMHYITAIACGEPVEALRFLTNGCGSSRTAGKVSPTIELHAPAAGLDSSVKRDIDRAGS
jgi:hypothetical protein